MSWSQRAKIVWKDAIMKDLLQQLRGQSAAIGLLIQALQMYDDSQQQLIMEDWLTHLQRIDLRYKEFATAEQPLA
jgi:hypothetical protein